MLLAGFHLGEVAVEIQRRQQLLEVRRPRVRLCVRLAQTSSTGTQSTDAAAAQSTTTMAGLHLQVSAQLCDAQIRRDTHTAWTAQQRSKRTKYEMQARHLQVVRPQHADERRQPLLAVALQLRVRQRRVQTVPRRALLQLQALVPFKSCLPDAECRAVRRQAQGLHASACAQLCCADVAPCGVRRLASRERQSI